jgi:hypothetical protein
MNDIMLNKLSKKENKLINRLTLDYSEFKTS